MIRPVDPALLVRGTADDPRLGSRVLTADTDLADVVLLGAADDTGITNGGGRPGAATGPTELRRWLYRQTTGLGGELETLRILDLGDVLPGATLEETHAEVERTVAALAPRAPTVVFLGGGHDLAYASHSGVFSACSGRAAIVNVDTHLDVRPPRDGTIVTSGTPFRRTLERWGDRVASYTVLAAQPQHGARPHAEWLRANRGRVVTLDELRQPPGVSERLRRELQVAAAPAGFATVSLDLDVVAAAWAPGVSAPPADGLAPEELARFMDVAGRDPKVALLDVVELSPPHDENGRTARLAALCVWRFLAGMAKRRR